MEFTMHEKTVVTNGQPPVVGTDFPDFKLAAEPDGTVSLADVKGKYTLISVVPDIDTRVCSLSTKKFNQQVDNFPAINFLTVSTNTPEQQKNWCAAEGVSKIKLLSDQEHQFGLALGLYIETAGIDARSIWLLDKNGTIIYRELVKEMTHEPDYEQVLAKIKTVL
ncbi:MAG: thiol peroxidase [Liquorilactobacillus ghanensis]|uniref:Thioredoxin peroxidase n=1 Tax=Liquorilactobacillus ghanensis DSM 18630 TaxID=1423750 RepID=A0A0R1VIV1_9LACO|nr:thiol peroxidase [Liquorilactobacillus ghanensis]KRM05624.1 thioredoxin peroxidase [Liquorilactobacillus ghanensis DSM 18630]